RQLSHLHPEIISALSNLRFIVATGAPTSSSFGQWAKACRLSITQLYGLSEVNGIMAGLPGWEFNEMAPIPSLSVRLVPVPSTTGDEPSSAGAMEVVLDNGPSTMIGYLNAHEETAKRYDPAGVFHTFDHVVPTRPGRFVYLARADELVVHSSGEKTQPGFIEALMLRSTLIRRCVYLGSGLLAGVLAVELDPSVFQC